MSKYHVYAAITDLRTMQSHRYSLATFKTFYEREVVLGRDPNCDIVIDADGVEPRHAFLTAASNHRMVRMHDEDMRQRHDGRPFRVGPYSIAVFDTRASIDDGPPPLALPVRFGGTRGIGGPPPPAVRDPDSDPEAEAEHARTAANLRRERVSFIAAIRSRDGHIRELDDTAIERCVARIRDHFERLSRALPHLPPIAPSHCEFTGSLAHACWRWAEEWSAVEAYPFVPATWAYVHRLAAWKSRGWPDDVLRQGLELASAMPWHDEADPSVLLDGIVEAISAHADVPDPSTSPLAPWVALAAEGAFAFALPDRATLIYLPSCARDTRRFHGADPAERPLLRALFEDDSDADSRLVYADMLEARGEVARAERLRAMVRDRAAGIERPPLLPRVEWMFSPARLALLPRPGSSSQRDAMTPAAGRIPTAWLEVDARGEIDRDDPVDESRGRKPGIVERILRKPIPAEPAARFTLGAHTAIEFGRPARAVDIATRPAPFEPHVVILYARGAFWIRSEAYATIHVSGRTLYGEWPLYDGDVITYATADEQVRATFRVGEAGLSSWSASAE